MEAPARRLPRPALPRSFRPRMSWELASFLGLALVALGLRLWELDGRTMHYDEAIHVHYAWRLAEGEGFSHSPWMHGPLQIHLTALVFKVFSDSDFTARLIYALFGAGLVFLPFFLRSHLGRTGALVTSLLLALSPSLLYFSRFGRNDILMVFFAVALLALIWRYLNEGRNRYLYMASAVLALAFATKETAYIMVVIFGIGLFLISITEIVPWLLGRIRLSEVGPAPAFLVLLVTLTLPQWSALASIPLGPVGLELVNEGVGDVGLPVLGDFVSFPLADLPLPVDLLIIVGIVVVPVGAVATRRIGWGWARWLLPAAVLAALAYAMVSLPHGTVPRGYLISLGVIAGALVASAIFGLMWRWKVWLVCAAIFYLIWGMLYTSVFSVFVQPHGFCPGDLGGFFGTLCSKAGGIYTGSWQGLGYWLAQQDVARAEQPSYYYFLTGSVYEFLPLIFGLIAVVYYVRKGDLFGLVLSFWAVATLVAYSLASEKMPWLLVNVAVPFILLTGKLANDLTQPGALATSPAQAPRPAAGADAHGPPGRRPPPPRLSGQRQDGLVAQLGAPGHGWGYRRRLRLARRQGPPKGRDDPYRTGGRRPLPGLLHFRGLPGQLHLRRLPRGDAGLRPGELRCRPDGPDPGQRGDRPWG